MLKLLKTYENWVGADTGSITIDFFKLVFFGLLPLAAILLAVITIPLALLSGGGESTSITLNTSDWVCTHTHSSLVGKVPVDLCDTYRMRGYE
jgi:hypothetical protein